MASSSRDTLRPRALVTGASSGIGRIFARRLAREGFDVVLVARRQGRLTELAKEIETVGAKADVVVADLATVDGLEIVERRVAAGDLTMLVNNAGFQVYMPFVELDPARAEAQINVHVTAVVRLCRAALPAMIARGSGSIINVSSMLAFSAGLDRPFLPKRATYAATKAFVNAFTETLSNELADTGVKVQVEASLAALALGDVICSPVLADRALLDREHEARHAVFGAGLGATLSPRYAAGQTAASSRAK